MRDCLLVPGATAIGGYHLRIGTNATEIVEHAYRLLKQSIYNDKDDLLLRAKIAAYEADRQFRSRQGELAEVVGDLMRSRGRGARGGVIDGWIDQIDFQLLPKSVTLAPRAKSELQEDSNSPRFISNVRSGKKYCVPAGAVQFFITAPVQVYILDIVWCILAGKKLDRMLGECCYGNRLAPGADQPTKATPSLFKMFYAQYGLWRDRAIQSAEAILGDESSAVLISLDIKKCYYNMEVDWDSLNRELSALGPLGRLTQKLTKVLEDVHARYRAVIADCLDDTIGRGKQMPDGLPIGLSSSRILANWILMPFDEEVRTSLQPAYYGRYVDDILIVAQAPAVPGAASTADGILDALLVDRGIIGRVEGGDEFVLRCLPRLTVQKSKLVVHLFDKDHSRAGLREFVELIKHEASDFRFLPVDELGREFDSCAYDILYEGSINKLRSITGVRENGAELSKYLARRMIEYRLTSESISGEVAVQLDRFARGKNLLDFRVSWEAMLTLLMVKGPHRNAVAMLERCDEAIKHLADHEGDRAEWTTRAQADMRRYLEIALGMALGLFGAEFRAAVTSRTLVRLIERRFAGAVLDAGTLRRSNLIRHSWVAWPLVNYTDYSGSLLELDERALSALDSWSIEAAERLSPRYIHSDERVLLDLLRAVKSVPTRFDEHFERTLELAEVSSDDGGQDHRGRFLQKSNEAGAPVIAEVVIPGQEIDKITVGIANLQVSPDDICASYEPLRSPNRTWKRQARLFEILNIAEREKCNMVVLPEVSVPYSWIPFMVSHARQSQMALVFGAEHWVSGHTAANLLVTVLPYRAGGKYRSCHVFTRHKNHYSPVEERDLGRLELRAPQSAPRYHVFDWRGARFSVFNCFELSNIKHRAAMRAEVDFLVGVEFNRDTPYFENIVESTVRDLNCYFVQVNTSQFGDSRVTAPKKSAEMNAVRVSGGLNATLLKAEINVRELNLFRCKEWSESDQTFKPTSAGFEHERIRRRPKFE